MCQVKSYKANNNNNNNNNRLFSCLPNRLNNNHTVSSCLKKGYVQKLRQMHVSYFADNYENVMMDA
jgi:hypothetical protein